MKLDILNIKGAKTGRTVTLPSDVFGIEPNDHAIYLAVKQYMANQRQGTHKAKERWEVSGATRKIRKQKGSGGARFGSIKNALFRGGPRVFGPRPRDYSQKMNNKTSVLARKSALSQKARDGQIIILENLSMDKPKTSEFKSVLDKLGVSGKKTLLVLEKPNPAVALSGRNLQKSRVMTASDVNSYAIVEAQQLIICEGAVGVIKERLSK